ncbi:imidazole glycerol phosphate synthase subunit HisH, partial [bacterium I07]
LNLIPGTVRRFEGVMKIPHMGWNDLDCQSGEPLFYNMSSRPFTYFVHSYYCIPDSSDDIIATSRYGIDFCAAVRKNNIWGVQFHPEKSHQDGLQMLLNFSNWNGK